MSVMNVKRGVQTWSKAEQAANVPREDGAIRQSAAVPNAADGPKVNTASATDFSKTYGEQAVGDVLNKIADPNWIDPGKKMRATGNNQLDKDAFFKLMLAQMKNQDPTNPMQSHEMAAQLAQFSSLEQLNNIGSGIESLAKAQSGTGNFGALGFIGKMVSGDASKVGRAAGDTEHGFNFTLGGDAAGVKVEVKDSTGKVVRNLDFGNMKKGANSIRWNGMTEEGVPARPGEYRFSVEAKNGNGAKVFAKSAFEGRISGIDFTAQGPMVIVNGQSIRLSDVKKIEDPSVTQGVGPGMGEVPQNWTRGAGAVTGKSPVGSKAEAFVPPAPEEIANNMDSVPMAGGLLAKVQKETGSSQ